MRRVEPDSSSLLAAAKRNAAGELVIEDAGDLDAELASAPGEALVTRRCRVGVRRPTGAHMLLRA